MEKRFGISRIICEISLVVKKRLYMGEKEIHDLETDSKWSILKLPFSRTIFFEFNLTVDWRCSINKVFLEISLASACNFIKKEALAQVFSCEFCKISRNTFSFRTPLVAVSDRKSWLIYRKVSLIFSTVIEFKYKANLYHCSALLFKYGIIIWNSFQSIIW